jgi:hypothetical protein
VSICQWSPAQNQLASGAADGVCRLWGLADLTEDKWASGSDGQLIPLTTVILPHSTVQGEKYKDVTSITWRFFLLHKYIFPSTYLYIKYK